MQRGVGDVFHALHERNQRVAVLGPAGGKSHAAVANHCGGHALLGAWPKPFIPGRLTVKVGMHIHKARRHQQSVGIDLLRGDAQVLADGGDAPVAQAEVCGVSGGAGAVHDAAVADQQVELLHVSVSLRFWCAVEPAAAFH